MSRNHRYTSRQRMAGRIDQLVQGGHTDAYIESVVWEERKKSCKLADIQEQLAKSRARHNIKIMRHVTQKAAEDLEKTLKGNRMNIDPDVYGAVEGVMYNLKLAFSDAPKISPYEFYQLPFEGTYYDAAEYSPCRDVGGGDIEQCDAGDADFWSVYLHGRGVGIDCVADVATEQQAKQLCAVLEILINQKKEGAQCEETTEPF